MNKRKKDDCEISYFEDEDRKREILLVKRVIGGSQMNMSNTTKLTEYSQKCRTLLI